MSDLPRFCIFCGKPPEQKNKEHVLPQWLIALTGDPKRTVNFGMDPRNGKVPRFDWSSFVFPACRSCNDKYSAMESNTKELIQKMIAREPIRAHEYVLILDWLDKVRIGLWLGYSYLHKNPTGIAPTFHIDSRTGQKDRMLAVYTIDSNNKGLNAFGAETLCFQYQPSCFSLNINNIYILNMSWDFMCSARCGFPYPTNAFINQDGIFECSDFMLTRNVKHPLIRRPFIKPSIHLFEPIIQNPMSKLDFPKDEWLANKLIPNGNNKGVIYRQWDDKVEVIEQMDAFIGNGNIRGHHCQPLKNIIAQTYEIQFEIFSGYEYKSSNKADLDTRKALNKFLREEKNLYINAFRNA